MKLSLVISTLTCGGAERVMTLLANEWVNRGNDVQLVTLDREPPFFDLDSRVKLVQLGCEKPSRSLLQGLLNLFSSVNAIRRALRVFASEAVIAFTTRVNVKALIAARPLRIPVVVSERADPSGNGQSRFWQDLTDRWYSRAKLLVVQTQRVVDHYRNRGLNRVEVIPNPVEVAPRRSAMPREVLFLVVARLHHEKGIDLLLHAWARSSQGRNGKLRILGDGPERAELTVLADTLGVRSTVEFAGFVSDKTPHWKEASAFVLSSRSEGFPNALCEAMAAGLACISFDCPTGPRELIRDGENGLLVPAEDIDAMASAMDRVAVDSGLRDRLAREASKITQSLGVASVVDRWEAALRS